MPVRIFFLLVDGPDLNLNDYYCAISPDVKKLAFTRGGGGSSDIYIASMKGGNADRLTFDNNYIYGLTWTKDGSEIVFSSNRGSCGEKFSIWRISATGGEPRQLPEGENLRNPSVADQSNLLACVWCAGDRNI